MTLDRCRVVLVRPRVAGNLGATARVMRNFGLSELWLVAPEASPDDRAARRRSTHGESILDAARVAPDLTAALADCLVVAATSARTGGHYRNSPLPPEAIAPLLVEGLTVGPTALVFGPERTGLTNEEVSRCHHLIHIPADPGYPALNLGQSVAILLYALRRAWLGTTSPPPPVTEAPADFAALDRMFGKLRGALEAVHFLYGPNADALMHGLRHLITRARPTSTEVDILFGLARQLRWIAEHGRDGKE